MTAPLGRSSQCALAMQQSSQTGVFMRFVLATTLLIGLATTSFADDKKKKDDAKDEPVRCFIVRAAEKDVTPPVEVDYTSKFRAKTKLAMAPGTAKTPVSYTHLTLPT